MTAKSRSASTWTTCPTKPAGSSAKSGRNSTGFATTSEGRGLTVPRYALMPTPPMSSGKQVEPKTLSGRLATPLMTCLRIGGIGIDVSDVAADAGRAAAGLDKVSDNAKKAAASAKEMENAFLGCSPD